MESAASLDTEFGACELTAQPLKHDCVLERAGFGRGALHFVNLNASRGMDHGGTKVIRSKTPESSAMVANVRRAVSITAKLNRLTFDDVEQIRALFGQLVGNQVDPSFLLIPPFYTTSGNEIRIGRNVFINQNCTFYDLGGIDIGDDVMIGPNVSLITSSHPLEPSQRRSVTIGKPIVIERNVWIAAGATVIGGVTIGENSVVAAGAVVTKDIPANVLVGGNPAERIRSIAPET